MCPRKILGLTEQCGNAGSTFHGWTVQAAGHLDGAALVECSQRTEFPVERRRVAQSSHTDVHLRARRLCYNVAARPAANHAGIHRQPLLQVCEPSNSRDLLGQFDDGVGPRAEIDPGVRSLAAHRDRVLTDALARRLQLAFQPRARFGHQHRAGFFGQCSRSALANPYCQPLRRLPPTATPCGRRADRVRAAPSWHIGITRARLSYPARPVPTGVPAPGGTASSATCPGSTPCPHGLRPECVQGASASVPEARNRAAGSVRKRQRSS